MCASCQRSLSKPLPAQWLKTQPSQAGVGACQVMVQVLCTAAQHRTCTITLQASTQLSQAA